MKIEVGMYPRLRRWLARGAVLAASLGVLIGSANGAAPPSKAPRCPVTTGSGPADFSYKPNAPLRSRVGTGFTLSGIVRSGIDCSIISGARVEFWRAGPNGYDDAHRGTIVTDSAGRYRFESDASSPNIGWRPHIHLRVAVPGYRTLVTVFFLRAGATAGTFDLVLDPDI
ncbi:MAG TPA: intradiol ring-cleavage dioxygenase [bacterium]|nr:intradiol ring-cleavage dioxygenase [bacterium]